MSLVAVYNAFKAANVDDDKATAAVEALETNRDEQRLRRIEDRIGQMDDRIGKVEERIGKVEERIGKVEDRIIVMEERIGKVEERIGKVEDRIIAVENKIHELRDEMHREIGEIRIHMARLEWMGRANMILNTVCLLLITGVLLRAILA